MEQISGSDAICRDLGAAPVRGVRRPGMATSEVPPAAVDPRRRALPLALLVIGAILSACGTGSGPSPQSLPSTSTSATAIRNGGVATPASPTITTSWIDQMSTQLEPVRPRPILFSPMFVGMSYDNLDEPRYSPAVLQEELSMLESTGAEGITIDLGYDPWLAGQQSVMAEDTRFIDEIRASGRLVVLKDASAERYRSYPLPWARFEAAWVQRVRTLAALYRPAYYTVIKEPGWYLPMIAGISRNPSSPADRQIESVSTWTSLLAKLVAAVHQVSPGTKVGVSIPGDSLYHSRQGPFYVQFMEQAARMPGVAFLGFDIYDTYAFTDTLRFLQAGGAGSTPVWINEAWSTTSPTIASESSRASLDVAWIRFLYQYALYIHAEGVSPFYTNQLASYGSPPPSASGMLRYFEGRTPVFGEFTSLVAANRQQFHGAPG